MKLSMELLNSTLPGPREKLLLWGLGAKKEAVIKVRDTVESEQRGSAEVAEVAVSDCGATPFRAGETLVV